LAPASLPVTAVLFLKPKVGRSLAAWLGGNIKLGHNNLTRYNISYIIELLG